MLESTQSDELQSLRDRHVPAAYLQHHPIFAASARGARITDHNGKSYLDFAGGIAVQNVGHRHPIVMATVYQQLEKLIHTGPVTLHEGYIRLAAEIAKRAPGEADNQVLFVNSGAEAVENAIKLARHATGRAGIIAFDRSFHGRTFLTSGLTGKASPYKTQAASIGGDIYHAPYPYSFRPPKGVPEDQVAAHCLEMLDDICRYRVHPSRIAALIIEPVQGEGGYIVPPRGFLRSVREWCRSADVLMIADEVQTGYGRTSRMFAVEHEAVEPDILVLGKSMAAGFPLAAVVASQEAFAKVHPGDIGGTYGGNPVACAAGLGVLRVFDEENLLERSTLIGERARSKLETIASRYPHVGEVRGLGSMLAMEIVDPGDGKTPGAALAREIVHYALNGGLLLIRAGVFDNVVRFLPPLVATDTEVEHAVEILSNACAATLPAATT